MFDRIKEHLLSIVFVTVIIGSLIIIVDRNAADSASQTITDSQYLPAFVNPDSPLEKAILKDVLNIYYPDSPKENSDKLEQASIIRSEMFLATMRGGDRKTLLDGSEIIRILLMYIKFIFVYLTVILLTYYGVITAGTWRFIRKQAKKERQITAYNKKPLNPFAAYASYFAGKVLKFAIHTILFSPAFVIAYSMKTELNTDSVFFMILLGVISNGLLIIYTNKFYSFLVAENRKGFIDTAKVKNLKQSYVFNSTEGIRLSEIFKVFKNFKGHIFDHIFENAVIQYSSTVKEQSAFLITGLIIIEMALNIHGYLNYEMLKQILYGNASIVLFIVLLLFYLSKITEAASDIILAIQLNRYRNQHE